MNVKKKEGKEIKCKGKNVKKKKPSKRGRYRMNRCEVRYTNHTK